MVNTLAPEASIWSRTTALFQEWRPGPDRLADLRHRRGDHRKAQRQGRSLDHAFVVLTCKRWIPAALIIALGLTVGIEGIFGVSILALLTIFGNSTVPCGSRSPASTATSATPAPTWPARLDDAGRSWWRSSACGWARSPYRSARRDFVLFVLGLFVGAVDREWTRVLEDADRHNPFMSFAVGAGINLGTVLRGGLDGLFPGLAVVGFTGGLTYLATGLVLRRGPKSGIGFAAGTTAGNAVAVPAVVAVADPRFQLLRRHGDRAGRDRRPGHRCARPHRRQAS